MYNSLLLTQSTTVISRQLSNIPTHGLLSKCKNNLVLPWTNQNLRKNDKSIELELSCYEGQHMITECSKAEQLYHLFVHLSAVQTIMILLWLEGQHMITVWSAVS